MIGAIITVRISDRRQQALAAQLDHRRDRCLLALGDQVVADERHQHEHAEQAVDHRRDARQQPDDRLEDRAAATSGANSTMNTAMNSEQTNAIATAPTVIRIVLQISGQAWKV